MKKNKQLIFNMICVTVAFICLISMYVFPDIVKNSVKASLKLCSRSLIPSLFPYITCTRICSELISRRSHKSTNTGKLFAGFSGQGLSAHLLGLISGFPGGAVLCANLYISGAIEKSEAERIVAFSNCISPAFCILFFGKEIMQSTFCGVIVFLSVLVSNLVLLFVFPANKKLPYKKTSPINPTYKKTSVTSIISDSAGVMLNICAFVTFFMCIGSLITTVLSKTTGICPEARAIICSVLEISAGLSALSVLPFGRKMLLGSILISFGGISAIMQVISICEKYGISAKKFIYAKILGSVLSPFFTFLFVIITPHFSKTFITGSLNIGTISFIAVIIFVTVLLFATIYLLFSQKERKNKL